MELSDRSEVCCFSGYRPEKMPMSKVADTVIPAALYDPLFAALRTAISAGYVDFITGMSRGFDLWAAQAVLILQREFAITLHCAIPYRAQEQAWAEPWRALHKTILERADSATILCPSYQPDCFHLRNRYMVDAAARLICFYDGQPGGTGYTVRYAKKCGLCIDNLAEDQLKLF